MEVISMILDKIVADKKIRLIEHKGRVGLSEMRERAENEKKKGSDFFKAMKSPGISIIGEFKKASPSLGKISSRMSLLDRIAEYNSAADAISCLTEEDHFLGDADDLKKVRGMSSLPILRKDFFIDEYQFYEAKVIGADAVLLIAAILDDGQLKAFKELAVELGMDALIEVHDEKEMERVLLLDADLIGINNRDLRDFSIKLETTKQLSKMVPEDKILVAESGIVSDEDVRFLKECNVDAFLIGRAFMESENPKELAKRWKAL